MFDALLTRIGGFRRAHRVGHVADEHDAELLRFVGRREISVPRDERLDLDEVDALVREVIHPPACIRGVRHGGGARKPRDGAVEHGARDDHPRSEEPAGGDFRAPHLEHGEIAAHVAHSRNAVGDEERGHHFFVARDPVPEYFVDVHVPETGNQILAGAVDEPRAGRRVHGIALAELDDALIFHDDRHVGLRRRPRRVDYRDMRDCNGGGRSGRCSGQRSGKRTAQHHQCSHVVLLEVTNLEVINRWRPAFSE